MAPRALDSAQLTVTLLPRFRRRLELYAQVAGRTPQREAELRLAASLVPDSVTRRRLARRDLADALEGSA